MEFIQTHFVAMVFCISAMFYWRLLERTKFDETWVPLTMLSWIAAPFAMMWLLPLVAPLPIAQQATHAAYGMWWAIIPALALAFPGDRRSGK